jgi:hypothetical protein
LLLTQDTMLPSLSAVDSTTVSPGILTLLGGPGVDARSGSTRLHSDAACDSESSMSSGTGTKSGSPL